MSTIKKLKLLFEQPYIDTCRDRQVKLNTNLIEHALFEIIADPIEIIEDIFWHISVAQPKPQTLYSELTKHYV